MPRTTKPPPPTATLMVKIMLVDLRNQKRSWAVSRAHARELGYKIDALELALRKLERPQRGRVAKLESMIRRLIPWAKAGAFGRGELLEVKEARKLLGPARHGP